MYEEERTYCFCDEGFVAEGLGCHAAISALRDEDAGEEIVRLATDQIGHNLAEIGLDRQVYPRALRQYVAEDALWCSDFVSWVYRAADAPMSGGYEGGWLVTSNRAIRNWFDRRGLFVSRRSIYFDDFVPLPGDYVRISTPRWGHSAIVERVEGDSLYIIEGNARGKVRRQRYRAFRRHPKISGFGIASHPAKRRRWRPALPNHWLGPLIRR